MEFVGKTVDEAIELALKELGAKKEEVAITVISEPTKGLFGKVKGNAVINVEKIEIDGVKKATEFLDKLLKLMNVDAKIVEKQNGENKVLEIITTDSSSVIGKRGETLDALEKLTGAMANTVYEVYQKVEVDCENYREKRKETLIALAKKLEKKATEMRREVKLEPMSAYERRIIHTALADSKTVSTKSEGADPNRYVLIVPFDKDEFSRPYDASRGAEKKRPEKRNNFNKKSSGFTKKPARSGGAKKSSASVFGTFLGNSRDNH